MANGTLHNLANEAFVRTPPSETQKVVRNLLRFSGPCTVFDPTAGEGDLLAPFSAIDGAHLVGVELDRNRAEAAIQALPDAQIIVSPIEGVKFDAPFCQVLALNPPYFFQNGKRAEYTITKATSEHLVAGGIAFGVYPARSGWGSDMVNFWAKNYRNIQVYRFPDGDPDQDEHAFGRFTQIVVIGQKRERPLSEPNKADVSRLRGFRYRKPDKPHESWWAGGTPPPELPTSLVEQPYLVPSGVLPCTYTLLKADESQLLTALMEHGYHHDPSWREDTTFTEDGMVAPSAMPMLGPAHIASEILTGMFDGEMVLDRYVMSTFITKANRQVEVDDEEREKGVVEIRQTMDHPIVGVLDITSGTVRYYVGADEAFSFITPLLPQLTPLVLKRRRPRYLPDEVRDWELEVVMKIGVDKTLPGATHPGLAVQQMHRTLAMWRLLNGHA